MTDSAAWNRYLEEKAERHIAELSALLRIPSVSALPEHESDLAAAADWLVAYLRRIGVPEVSLLETGAGPVVYGHWPVPGQPTVLIYGHYDVQPADPLDLWETPPFEPTIRDGRLYARGASDDKGAVFSAIAAVEALTRDGPPPLGLKFFIEGEEEVGSGHLPALVAAERERLACDVIVSADGVMYGRELPSLTIASKGLAACQIDLRTAETDMHSGQFGAAVANAARAMAEVVANFHTADGRVAVEGFYDDVRDLTPEERLQIDSVPFDEAAFLREINATEAWGEAGYTLLERVFARPTLDVNGLWGGFQGGGAKTVTPCEAHAKVSCRLVPNQDPSRILDLIERHLETHQPTGATATLERFAGSARPFAIAPDHPALTTAAAVLRDLYDREPLMIRLGGTLPVAEIFQRELGADMVFFAWEMPDARLHAPNEFIALDDFQIACRAYCRYLTALARS